MKHMTLTEWLCIASIAIILLLLGGCALDMACGVNEYAETTVIGKHHKPAWTEHKTEWISGKDLDDDGINDVPGRWRHYTVHHPDQWIIQAGAYGECHTTMSLFSALNLRDQIVVVRRVGRFTGICSPWKLDRIGTLRPE